jgi:hypothetical protein
MGIIKQTGKALTTAMKSFRNVFIEETESPNTQINRQEELKRGYKVYFTSQLLTEYARDKTGRVVGAERDDPYFSLSPDQRLKVMQYCTPVLGIVSSRMNRIAAKKFIITSDKEQEDLIVDRIKDVHRIYKEYMNQTDPAYMIAKAKLAVFLKQRLPELTPDLSNFDPALLRWSKRIKQLEKSKCDEIRDWLEQPNQEDNWMDFVKQWVCDDMIHGGSAVYKQVQNGKLENMYILPGGTVLPVRGKFVSTKTAYLQMVPYQRPLLYYSDELIYNRYLPNSGRSYGVIPLEALINKIAETLLFDKLMADQADGSKMPEKMIVITESNPFGDIDNEFRVPIDKVEQRRIDKKVNTLVKGGVITFSGNNATVVDLTRENTMALQMQRQKDIREDVALVFNMTNMEVNLTGSGDTSGRATSESQAEIEEGKGTLPMMAMIEHRLTTEAIPFRCGRFGYFMQFHSEDNETAEFEKLRLKLSTGLYSVNEIKMKDLNENPFDDPIFDKPPGTAQQADGSQVNPINIKALK